MDLDGPRLTPSIRPTPTKPVHRLWNSCATCTRRWPSAPRPPSSTNPIGPSPSRATRIILGSLPEQAKALVKSSLDPTTLKNAANDELDQLKSEPVKTGDTWKRTKSSNLGGGQVMTFDTEFTYAGTIEKGGRTLDKITSKILSATFAFEDSPLPIAAQEQRPESAGIRGRDPVRPGKRARRSSRTPRCGSRATLRSRPITWTCRPRWI